jgi:REP element-mobilizing transposase RayT
MDVPVSRPTNRLKNHARYFDPAVVYHVTSKTLRGEFFLHPSDATNELILGVLGRAQYRWPQVRLFAYVFMSNHFHLMIQGDPESVPGFVGFIKREISRRRGIQSQSRGPMWQRRYEATALPSANAQLKCLKYILSHGVKEGLVERPGDWPGIHCAKQLVCGETRMGRWLNGTRFGKAVFQARDRKKQPPSREDYVEGHEVKLAILPCWKSQKATAIKNALRRIVDQVVQGARDRHRSNGSRVMGVEYLRKQSPKTRREVPPPPWFEFRRKQIVAWAKRRDPAVLAYLNAYWEFQSAFKRASKKHITGKSFVTFPVGGWRPPVRPLKAA